METPPTPAPTQSKGDGDLRYKINRITLATLVWGRDRVPPGIRSLVGIAFMIGGVFGFLPVLGFWMFPLGVAFVALDVPPARRRIERWIESLATRIAAYEARKAPADPPA